MKGIILAGGSGTRLYPITKSISKQLVPIYNKPMIYYPLSVLMLADIKDILIITTPEDKDMFIRLLGNGSQWGISLTYEIQPSPDGLAQAFIIGEQFIGNESVCLILGDNIFFGHDLGVILEKTSKITKGAAVFGYYVNDPERYGVVEFDNQKKAISLEEKPTHPKSNYAVTGLYFYDNTVVKKAKSLKPSKRGELEITDLNQLYLDDNTLEVKVLGRGIAWLDTGTHDSLLDASNFIAAIENRQGLMVACLEEIAYTKGYISKQQVLELAEPLKKNGYGEYIKKVVSKKIIE